MILFFSLASNFLIPFQNVTFFWTFVIIAYVVKNKLYVHACIKANCVGKVNSWQYSRPFTTKYVLNCLGLEGLTQSLMLRW